MSWHRAIIRSRQQLTPTVTGLTLEIIPSQLQPPQPRQPQHALVKENDRSEQFTFLPGQWVDFQPLITPTTGSIGVGGYSITSLPSHLPTFHLAVQSSRHPVAEWVTKEARVEDLVDVRVGGRFTYTKNEDKNGRKNKQSDRLLFIAGGVGINPLFSMIQQWHHDSVTSVTSGTSVTSTNDEEDGNNQQQRQQQQQPRPKQKQQQQQPKQQQHNENQRGKKRAVLLYSVRTIDELIFVKELDKISGERPDEFRVVVTTTKMTTANADAMETTKAVEAIEATKTTKAIEATEVTEATTQSNSRDSSLKNVIAKSGRIDHDVIHEAIHWLNRVSPNESNHTTSSDSINNINNIHNINNIKNNIHDLVADAVYVCGPPGIPEDMLEILSGKGLVRSMEDVFYEKWW